MLDPDRPWEQGVVAVATFDGMPVFGVNSNGPRYSDAVDRFAADAMRETLVERYPDDMRRNNIGEKPNDAVYHAEATILFRMGKLNSGSLEGRTIEVHVDDTICWSCREVLPRIGWELGNPTVTYVNLRTGERRTMRDRDWISR